MSIETIINNAPNTSTSTTEQVYLWLVQAADASSLILETFTTLGGIFDDSEYLSELMSGLYTEVAMRGLSSTPEGNVVLLALQAMDAIILDALLDAC